MINDYNPFSLKGKTILITGASSGIGKSTAIECSKLGARLILLGRDLDRLNDVYLSLEKSNHIFKSIDLNYSEDVLQYVNELPILDGIVFSAGIQKTCPIKFIDKNDVNDIFATNFFSIIDFNKKLLNSKKLRKGSSVVFISSTAAGIVADYGNAIYSSSKGALNAFAKVLALELSTQKIRVNCVLPAMVKTPLLSNISVDKEQLEIDEKRYPLGYGEPIDVAHAVIYLLSDASKWLTGTSILLDGGLTLK